MAHTTSRGAQGMPVAAGTKTSMRKFLDSRWLPVLAYLFIAFALVFLLQRSADTRARLDYKNSVAACQRGNKLRTESNNRIAAHQADKQGLVDFLEGARRARLAGYVRNRNSEDLKAARNYAAIIKRVNAQVRFDSVALVDCPNQFTKP